MQQLFPRGVSQESKIFVNSRTRKIIESSAEQETQNVITKFSL